MTTATTIAEQEAIKAAARQRIADAAAASEKEAAEAAQETAEATTAAQHLAEVRTAAEAEISEADAVIARLPRDGVTPQFLAFDAGKSGSNRDYWSEHLKLRWKNKNTGDHIDAEGTPQGKVPYVSVRVTKAKQHYDFDITALVRKWIETGENRGAMLRTSGSSVSWAGRLAAAGIAYRPQLLVTTDQGAFDCPCLALAGFTSTSGQGRMTLQSARSSATSHVMPQFDLSGIRGTVQSAVMRLYCTSKSSLPATVKVHECDPPRFLLAGTADMGPPLLGLAAGGEAALQQHPDVLRAGDFSEPRKLFDKYGTSPVNPHELLPDPRAPGSIMFRGSFNPDPTGKDRNAYCQSMSAQIDLVRGDTSDPMRKPDKVIDELYQRLEFELEDDWTGTRDANKMAIGWDLRYGPWVDSRGGFWDHQSGNGGTRGDGKRRIAPAGKFAPKSAGPRNEYRGHSIRMEAGRGRGDGNPYDHLRPVQSYIYHLDQKGTYGTVVRLGNVVIPRNYRVTAEQRLKMNSIEGPFDALGNGEAVADGELETWIDGVQVSLVTGLRWRRHPDMGIIGPFINQYHGGEKPTWTTMHYLLNHFALATKYIGPRVG